MNKEKSVDESWKESASSQKEHLINTGQDEPAKQPDEPVIETPASFQKEEESPQAKEHTHDDSCGCGTDHKEAQAGAQESIEVNFLNYIASMGFQAMIFIGEIAHPVSNKIEKNLDQAKFIIDTLSMLKDKTKGNLNEQEENMLTATVYELQQKYVDVIQKEATSQESKES